MKNNRPDFAGLVQNCVFVVVCSGFLLGYNDLVIIVNVFNEVSTKCLINILNDLHSWCLYVSANEASCVLWLKKRGFINEMNIRKN